MGGAIGGNSLGGIDIVSKGTVSNPGGGANGATGDAATNGAVGAADRTGGGTITGPVSGTLGPPKRMIFFLR
jgi:hypothetical protein